MTRYSMTEKGMIPDPNGSYTDFAGEDIRRDYPDLWAAMFGDHGKAEDFKPLRPYCEEFRLPDLRGRCAVAPQSQRGQLLSGSGVL